MDSDPLNAGDGAEPRFAECPTPGELDAIAGGAPMSDEVAAHIARCERCSSQIRLTRFSRHFGRVMSEMEDGATTPSAKSSLIGAAPRIFGYRLHEEVARGGQGVIYRATQETTGRMVAVKVLHSEHSSRSSQSSERLKREIRIVGSLDHPGVVRIFDSIKLPDGRDALVMELIEGDPLERWISERPDRSERDRLELLAEIADAVHHAHQRGVIHRDLKPSNILIDAAGRPHVLDFGVARRTDPDEPYARITRTGEFTGTLAYAAPEQVAHDAQPPDVRTDVYALGVIGFELLTGRPPYSVEGSLHAAIERILTNDPPSRTQTGVSGDAWTVLAKAMAKDMRRRYDSAADLARDLRSAARGDAILARGDSRWYVLRKTARRHRTSIGVAGLLMLAIAGVLLSLAVGNVRLSEALRTSRLLQIRAQLAAGGREQAEQVLWREMDADLRNNRDPADALWSGSSREMELLWCYVELQGPAMCLRVEPDAVLPAFGVWPIRDGGFAAATPDRWFARVELDGSAFTFRRLWRIPDEVIAMKVAPSGEYAICLHAAGISSVAAESGEPMATLRLIEPPTARIGMTMTDWGVAISDDDGGLRVLSVPTLEPMLSLLELPAPQTPWLDPALPIIGMATADATLRVIDLESGRDIPPSGASIFDEGGPDRYPQLLMSPDRTQIAVAYGGGLRVRSATSDEAAPPLLDHPGYRVWASHDPSWSLLTASANGDPTLRLWDTRTWRELNRLPGHRGSVITHGFTPDGRRIVTTDAIGVLRLWAAPGHGWRSRFGPATARAHQISVDRASGAIFAPNDVGSVARYDAGGGATFPLGPAPAGALSAVRTALSDDGAFLAAADLRSAVEVSRLSTDGTDRVHTLRIDSAETIAGLGFRPRSTSATLAVCVNPAALLLVDPHTGEATRRIDLRAAAPASDMAWSPDGERIAVSFRDGTLAVIDDAEHGAVRILDVGARHIRSVAFTPDGAHVAAVGEDGVLQLVDVRTGRSIVTPRLSEHSLFCVAVHPDGQVALVGDRAGVVKAVNLRTMTELARFDAGGSVMSLEFTRDGQSVAVAALDRPVELWRFTELARTLTDVRPELMRSRP